MKDPKPYIQNAPDVTLLIDGFRMSFAPDIYRLTYAVERTRKQVKEKDAYYQITVPKRRLRNLEQIVITEKTRKKVVNIIFLIIPTILITLFILIQAVMIVANEKLHAVSEMGFLYPCGLFIASVAVFVFMQKRRR